MKKYLNFSKRLISLLFCIALMLMSSVTFSAASSDYEVCLWIETAGGYEEVYSDNGVIRLSVEDTVLIRTIECAAYGEWYGDYFLSDFTDCEANFYNDFYDCFDPLVLEAGDWIFTIEFVDEYAACLTFEKDIPAHEHNYDEEGICSFCSDYEPADLNADEYYEIENKGQLFWFAKEVNKGETNINAILMNDIVLNDLYSDEPDVWQPICEYTGGWHTADPWFDPRELKVTSEYNGVFDGNNKTISGVEVEDTFDSFKSLFGVVGENGVVKDLTVEDSYYATYYYADSGIAGLNYGKILNCEVISSYVQFASIANFNFGEISGTYNSVGPSIIPGGGIVNINWGTVSECANTIDITSGGIVSINLGTVSDCYNTGTIVDGAGIVDMNCEGAVVERCYNTGYMMGDHPSGIVVANNGVIRNCYNSGSADEHSLNVYAIAEGGNGEFINCYNSVEYIDSYGWTVPFPLGNYMSGTYINCYNIGEYYGVDENNGNTVEVTGKTIEEFASGEVAYLLQGTQTDDIWGQNIDNGNTAQDFPVLNGARVYKQEKCSGEITYLGNTEIDEEVIHNYNSDSVCTDCYALKEGEVAGVAGHNLSLADNLKVNYYVAIDESVFEDEEAKVVFTVGDGEDAYTIEKPLKDATSPATFDTRNRNGLYAFTCDVAAKEATANIYAKLVANGEETRLPDYSVITYAESILADEDTYAEAIPLVKAMLNYSAAAQVYFNYNTDNLANSTEYMSDEDRVVETDIDLSEYEVTLTGETEGVSYYGSSLVLESETSIKHYFIIDSSVDTDALAITVDTEDAELTKNGNLYMVEIKDIYARDLGTVFEVKVGDLTLEYGVFSYGNVVMNTNKEALKNTVCALYDYYLTAIE